MGLKDDLERYREVGEKNRQDLTNFIKYGDLAGGREIQVPIKIIELPGFEYDQLDVGGIGQGEGIEEGDPVEVPDEEGDKGDDGDGNDAGEGTSEHDYYEMNPEEFAQELDEELGLDLEPKGKKVVEEIEGDFTDVSRTGPNSTLDLEHMFKEGLKRKLAFMFDEEYCRELLRVSGIGPSRAFEWARNQGLPVSQAWFEDEYDQMNADERSTYDSIEDISKELERSPKFQKLDKIPFRREDERFRYPETTEEKEKNVVVINIRDVSGSMGKRKQELVERVFTPLDWYLQGKYENAEFVYIAHDSEAWEVKRDKFFGIHSSGGTTVSSAYKVAQQILEDKYPWSEWNRFVFAAGDGENSKGDTKNDVIPLMEEIDANKHAYVETIVSQSYRAKHGKQVKTHFSGNDNVTVARVSDAEDVPDVIQSILSDTGNTGDTNNAGDDE